MTHTHSPIPRLIFAVLALAGSLTACQRELVVDNPNFDPEKNEVVANLVLNVNTGQNTGTKMSATNVQKANNFLGIQDAVLIPFETGNTSGESYVTLKPEHTSGTQMYSLGVLFGSNQVNAPQNEGASSTRIVQLSIPVGTDAMLFYGKAVNNGTGHENWQTRGGIVSSIKQSPDETRFNLVSRLTGDKAYIPTGDTEISVDAYNQTARLMQRILNYILDSSAPSIESYDGFDRYPGDATATGLNSITWERLGDRYSNGSELRPLEKILAVPYAQIMNIGANEYRAASSDAVRRMIEDLYAVVKSVSEATPLDGYEANVKRLAKLVIQRRIERLFVTDLTASADDRYWFRPLATLKSELTSEEGGIMTEADFNTNFGKSKEPKGFPYYDFHIPEGAAQMGVVTDGSGHKSIIYKIPNRALLHPEASETNVTFPPYQYTYPAELAYYVNSPLLVTSATDIDNATSFPNGYKNWYNPTKWTSLNKGWALGNVSSSTHGVAVRDNINYGVALLETRVNYKEGLTYFNDNRSAVLNNGEGNQTINKNDLNLELYGVLIGGQHPEANWQYLSTSNSPADYKFVLYDDDVSDDQSKVPTTDPVYTLVFDNYINAEQQLDVPIALEFINHGDDFWGRDNMIRNGGTFYLLGKLKVSGEGATTSTIDWDTISKNTENRYGYQVPPIYGVGTEAVPDGKTAGKSKQVTRVFIQNFVTKANFILDENSLKHAYVTVPDLRSTQMSVGLSVDLHWEDGLSFEVAL